MSSVDEREKRWFRFCLSSALLFFIVSLLVLGFLVWYFTEWGLAEVGKQPLYDDGRPFASWDFLGSVFVAVLISPFLGLAFDPLLRILAVHKHWSISPPLAAAVAVPFWYASFVPTYFLCLSIVDDTTRTLLLIVPGVCAVLTGALHLLMVHFTLRSGRTAGE